MAGKDGKKKIHDEQKISINASHETENDWHTYVLGLTDYPLIQNFRCP